ncbi:hypothetical protein C361_03805 [Cryptococcus neoformans Tu259-1]|uniref:Uncharacterized protein n=1 Tax=Cryptococcus neoformans Tu259-1 TaxID=1230072 RepID=A0A854QGW5_CRYNE|nr:hypothetical protein C361_03805 [Cryptococcus neoformans var. grubii Tu259-1]
MTHTGSSQWYLHHLDAHIKASRRSYLGQSGNTTVKPLRTTPVPPTNNIWTSYDKQLFFAALSRHSRLRPDLIASDVGKCVAEVQWYLDLLETSRKIHESKERVVKKRGLERNGYWREVVAPAAREVSDEWILKEEKLATEAIAIIEQKEKEEDRVFRKKRKRKARSELNKEVDIPRDTKPGERKRIIESWSGTEEMEKRWEAEEWLEFIGVDKLPELDHLIWNFWLDDYKQEVAQSATPPIAEPSSDDENPSAGPSNGFRAPDRGSREERIARDHRNLSVIQAIPKKRRTSEQRMLLTQILNRQQCRERYRTKRLLEEGMTKAEIHAAGGADVIFAKKSQVDLSTEMSESLRETGISDRQRSKRPEVMDCLKNRGLDIFVYESMSRFLQLDGQTNLSIALSTIQGLYIDLLKFLKPLILNSIVIAEQSAAQEPSKGVKNDDDFAVTSLHVQQAWTLRCADALPFQNKSVSKTDVHSSPAEAAEDHEQRRSPEGRDKGISIVEYGSESTCWSNLSRELFPPDDVSWGALTSFFNHHPTILDPHSLDATPLISDSEQESDAEDKEDAMLHDVLHKVDMEHDRLYEDSLWEALDSNDVDYAPDDKNGSWNGDAEMRSETEQEYINLHRRIREVRRKRNNVAWRRARYLSSHGEHLASKMGKNAISEAFIDDDTEGGLEGSSSEAEDEEAHTNEEEEREVYYGIIHQGGAETRGN